MTQTEVKNSKNEHTFEPVPSHRHGVVQVLLANVPGPATDMLEGPC